MLHLFFGVCYESVLNCLLQTCVLEEVFSPILTPLILICAVRHKAQDIVDFFHNFTVDVTGVGDVCSFAQMNIKKHGNLEVGSIFINISMLSVALHNLIAKFFCFPIITLASINILVVDYLEYGNVAFYMPKVDILSSGVLE